MLCVYNRLSHQYLFWSIFEEFIFLYRKCKVEVDLENVGRKSEEVDREMLNVTENNVVS